MSDNHGNTPAAWTAVVVGLVGFVVGGVGLMLSPVSMPIFYVGVGDRRRVRRAVPRDGQDGLPQRGAPPLTVGSTAPPVPAPAPPERGRRARLLAPALVVGGLGLATLALHLRDPHQAGSWGLCPSALLGWWCPGCGGLRAVHDLTHLQVADAASSNLALVVAIPVFAGGSAGGWCGAGVAGERPVPVTTWLPLLVTAVTVVAVFTVLRNTAAGAWLAP